MPELGKRLKLLREEKGLSLEEAGEELNIKSEDLRALEEEDFFSFPDRQFAVTVLNLYVDFLGLDKEQANQEFSQVWPEFGPLRTFGKRLFQKPKQNSPQRQYPSRRKAPLFALALVLCGGIFLYSSYSESFFGGQGDKKIQPEETTGTVSGSEQVPDEASELELDPTDVKTEVVGGEAIFLEITTPGGECWLEVVADGEQVCYLLVPQNTKPLTFTAYEEMSVLIGDAAAAKIKCNGKDLGLLGNRGVVIKRVFLTKDYKG
ncbi:MAG TPA: DUF4115 domain-containing protein [Clostridia bacterium]|nr:DUF4115 domain-containing protein [Clostridia bacterium]